MIIVGDIGNTETKICLVNSKNTIIKRVILVTKKIMRYLNNDESSYVPCSTKLMG